MLGISASCLGKLKPERGCAFAIGVWLEPDGYCQKDFLFLSHYISSPLAWRNRLFKNHFYLCLLLVWVEGLGALLRIHGNNKETK